MLTIDICKKETLSMYCRCIVYKFRNYVDLKYSITQLNMQAFLSSSNFHIVVKAVFFFNNGLCHEDLLGLKLLAFFFILPFFRQ